MSLNKQFKELQEFIRLRTLTLKRKSGPLFIALSGLFLLTALGGLIWIAQVLNQSSFDNRQQASVANGSVIVSSPDAGKNFPIGEDQRIAIQINTTGEPIVGIELAFNIDSDSIQNLRLIENDGGNGIEGYQKQFGELVQDKSQSTLFFTSGDGITTPIHTAAGKVVNGKAVPQHSLTLFWLEFDVIKEGAIEINFDVESSIAPSAISDPGVSGEDLLRTIPIMRFTTGVQPTTAPTEAPSPTTAAATPTGTNPGVTITTGPQPSNTPTAIPSVSPSATPGTPSITAVPSPGVTISISQPSPTPTRVTATPIQPSNTPTTQPTAAATPTTAAPTAVSTPTAAAATPTTRPTATQGPTSAPVSKTDDFYFLLLNDAQKSFTFYKAGTNEQVNASDMQSGRQYRVVHTSYIQNTNKQATSDYTTIPVHFKVENSALAKAYIARASMADSSNGTTYKFEVNFIANTENRFKLTIDPDNNYTETDENNNTWTSVTFRTKDYLGTGGSSSTVTYKQCNDTCNSNRDCAPNFRCFDTGSDKRCRLITNVFSANCGGNVSVAAEGKSCNGSCANASDCRSGLTCWYNQCRDPFNVESTSCAVISDAQQRQIVAGTCNNPCSSDSQCGTNFRCYYGSCRLATNPTSSSCTAVAPVVNKGTTINTNTVASVVTPTVAVTTAVSPSPTTATSPSPSTEPTTATTITTAPTQIATTDSISDDGSSVDATEQSALDSTRATILGWFSNLAGDQNSSLLLWVLLAGVALLLIAILFFIMRAGKSTTQVYRPPTQAMKSSDPRSTVGAQPQTTHSAGNPAQTNPGLSTPQNNAASGMNRPPSSMLNRVKEKSITPPQNNQQ